MRSLERAGRLKRKIEFLPTDDEIAERQAAKQGLTSPERAVLLAYSKMWLYDELLDSDVPEDPLVADMLLEYFPKPLQQRYSEPMQRHPLQPRNSRDASDQCVRESRRLRRSCIG